jgi:hypothetical protein
MGKIWGWIAIVASLSIGAAVAQTGAGRALLRSAGLSSPSGSYTALSFATPQALPARLESRVVSIPVSFVIRNASGSSSVYHWVILLSHTGTSLAAAAGQVRVPHGAKTTVKTTIRTVCAGGRLQLTVHLADPAESIDFWTACWSSKGSKS